jgi:uncharacterized protein YndB with AHSA1/START domain
MDATARSDSTRTERNATVERRSEREVVVTRTVSGPPSLVFEAWTRPELFERWWIPKSYPISLRSCEMDARVGGGYRLVLEHEGSTMEFFGRYLEVTPTERLVWTNDEGDEGATITTVTFEDADGDTIVTVHDLYPSKDAVESGSADAMPESLEQLDELLRTLPASERR